MAIEIYNKEANKPIVSFKTKIINKFDKLK